MTLLLNIVSATYKATPATPTGNSGTTCTTAQGDFFDLYATADATTSTERKCIAKANQVYDCVKYKTDGECFC